MPDQAESGGDRRPMVRLETADFDRQLRNGPDDDELPPLLHGGSAVASDGVIASTGLDRDLSDQSTENGADRLHRVEALVDGYHEAVYRYAFHLVGCSSAAEDIAQEVFLRAFRSVHQLREEKAAKGWLLVITRNEFARWCRKRPKSTSIDNDSSPELPDEPAQGQTRQLEDTEWVQAALKQLSNEYRQVLLMYYYEELSYAEIAEQLSIPIGTVMSRLSRGKKALREHLDKLENR